MSYKVVRDALNSVVCYGPNTPHYEPSLASGHVLSIEANAPTPTPQEQLKAIEQAIEKHMDEVAQAKRYDNRDSCRLYAGYVNQFQYEAIAYGQWVSSCWVASNQAQEDIIAGTRTIPTPEEAILELPVMVWPV